MVRRILLVTMALLLLVMSASAQEAVTPTPSPTNTLVRSQDYITYIVQYNDTLGSIAARFGVSMRAIMDANNMYDPDLVVIRQPIRIPVTPTPSGISGSLATTTETPLAVVPADQLTGTPVPQEGLETPLPVDGMTSTPLLGEVDATPLPPDESGSTPLPLDETPLIPVDETPLIDVTLAIPSPTPTSAPTFDYGVQVFFDDQSVLDTTRQITAMGMTWAKVRVSWREMQSDPTSIDYTKLDTIVDGLEFAGLHILLTVADAPDWSRSSTVENGPPDNFGDYATFVGTLAARYAGRVTAYEIWNEPNLRREWNNPNHPISADSYAEMLLGAYLAVKAADPAATVVSAGLAPTGFNDGINAVDDREYLTRLYSLGLASMSDAVGAHPFGYGNPPDSVCCDAPAGVATHYGHPSFYFLNTLNDYRSIMLASGDTEHPIWVTAFGWGTSADAAEPPPVNSEYFGYVTPEQQAEYTARAFELGGDTGFVNVMILFNLNSCAAEPANTEDCYYSLIAASGQQRPAYRTLSLMFAAAR